MIVDISIRVLDDSGNVLAISGRSEMLIQIDDIEQNILTAAAKVAELTEASRESVNNQMREIRNIHTPPEAEKRRPFGRSGS